ncbi:MAG TPA: hypothetical protein VLU23_14520 [Pseudolabrys sp.]|nr:hypothetical protein [Pseudolabrys sp.]
MAIHRKAKDKRKHAPANSDLDVTLPSFSFPPSDKLAQIVIDAWAEGDTSPLLERDPQTGNPTSDAVDAATERVKAAGYDLKCAVVITEEEHDNDYTMQKPNEVVFVLPNRNRVKSFSDQARLLDTAKLLMACTPNGI